MKCLLVAVATLAVAQAASISSQYHSQDGHKGYSYGYMNKDSEKDEVATHDRVQGSYKFSDKNGVFHSEVRYNVPREEDKEQHQQKHHGFGHHHEQPKPFSYSSVSQHSEQKHHQEPHYQSQHHHQPQHHRQQFHYERQGKLHHLHKRSLWHHSDHHDHQQQLSVDDFIHHQPQHHGDHEEQKHWTGPLHIPVIKNGVPTESPEVKAARKHHAKKVAEAHQHTSHSEHYNNDHHEHHEQHHEHHHEHHHQEPKWNGPIHVPVIEHGVPTETPEVKHAKALFHLKHSEAKAHAAHSKHHDDYDHSDHKSYYGAAKGHKDHHEHQQKWTGPIHVPVIKHGVPTETPEIRAAKAHHAAKHSEAHHSGSYHDDHHDDHHDNHYAQHYSYHDDHQQRWSGPTHKPVIVHGVPTETPEVRHAKAHFAAKHAEQLQHAEHFGAWDQGHGYAQEYHHADHHQWTGPIHVPVIEHGVPTETPEVRHAKIHFHEKHHEAQSHAEFDKDCDDEQQHSFEYQLPEHIFHEEPRWTGPIHVPVLHHGVPTETPEVLHAKEHLSHAHALAQSHEVNWHKSHKHY